MVHTMRNKKELLDNPYAIVDTFNQVLDNKRKDFHANKNLPPNVKHETEVVAHFL